MKLVYNNKTGEIHSLIPIDQSPRKYNGIIDDDISVLLLDNYPSDNIRFYKVINGGLVRRTDSEINDMIKYRRVLTDTERINILLKPSKEDIRKAESTLEILSTLQEVGLV